MSRFHRLFAPAASAGLVVALACAPAQEPAPSSEASVADAPAPAPLSAVQELGVRNAAAPLPGLITAAQLTEEQLEALSRMGYGRFISLRVPSEEGAGWEEAHATASDIAFDRIPVAGAEGLTRENVEALDRLLDEADEGTVLYCASSNRVGALLALRAYWLDGADPEAALELGRAAGMTRLEGPVTELLSQPR